MAKKITKIEQVENVNDAGYEILFDDNTFLKLLIGNSQYCCEIWGCEHWGGFLDNHDDLSYYIGSEFLGCAVVKEDEYVLVENTSWEEGIFIDIKTSLGVFQIAVYNSHNGYYGHGVEFIFGEQSFNTII